MPCGFKELLYCCRLCVWPMGNRVQQQAGEVDYIVGGGLELAGGGMLWHVGLGWAGWGAGWQARVGWAALI